MKRLKKKNVGYQRKSSSLKSRSTSERTAASFNGQQLQQQLRTAGAAALAPVDSRRSSGSNSPEDNSRCSSAGLRLSSPVGRISSTPKGSTPRRHRNKPQKATSPARTSNSPHSR